MHGFRNDADAALHEKPQCSLRGCFTVLRPDFPQHRLLKNTAFPFGERRPCLHDSAVLDERAPQRFTRIVNVRFDLIDRRNDTARAAECAVLPRVEVGNADCAHRSRAIRLTERTVHFKRRIIRLVNEQ